MDSDEIPIGEYPELPPLLHFLTPQGFLNFRNPLLPPLIVTQEMLH